jgi:WD40 repeat protein
MGVRNVRPALIVLALGAAPAMSAVGGQSAAASEADSRPRLVAQVGHSVGVNSVAVSSDGRLVLTGSDDNVAKLWDAHSGKEIRSFVGHSNGVNAVAFSPGGRFVLTGSSDGARLWDAETGKVIRPFVKWGGVESVAFSPNGRFVLTGSGGGTTIWDAETGREIRSFVEHSPGVSSVAFSPDGRFVLVGKIETSLAVEGPHRSATLLNAETGDVVHSFSHSDQVVSAAFSPDGRFVLTGSWDKTAKLWDSETGKEVRSFVGHKEWVTSVAFSPDGRLVLTGSKDDTARLWDAKTGRETCSFVGHSSEVRSVSFSPDGRTVLTGSQDGTAKLWDAETGKEVRSFVGLSSFVSSVAFSPNGRFVLTGTGTTAKLWDAEAAREVRSFVGHTDDVTDAVFSPNGRFVLTGSWDRSAKLWDTETGKEVRSFKHPDHVRSVAFSPDGRLVLTGSWDQTAKLWGANTGKEIRSFKRDDVSSGYSHAEPVAFSPDGRFVLTGHDEEDGPDRARLWDAETGKWTRSFVGEGGPVTGVAFSPDGHFVLTGRSRGAMLWDAKTGKEVHSFVGHSDEVNAVAFSPDSRAVLTGSSDATARLWDVETGKEIRSFVGHSSLVTSVAFSPNGRLVLTGSLDQTTKLWDAATGRLLATLVSFNDGTWAVVDPDGRYDASNGGDVEGLHWVVGNTPVALSQLKERYYEPGLLAKVMGFNQEPFRPVGAFISPKLFPEVEVKPPPEGTTRLTVHLKNQGGGIGKVRVLVNGKELAADARGSKVDPNATEATLTVDLKGASVKPGQSNEITVLAWNAEGYLSSRGFRMEWKAPGEERADPPEVYAIVVGTNQYSNPALSLRFSGKDAADVAEAIRLSARRLFGAERVHLTLLTDFAGAKDAEPATRASVSAAFQAARKAKPGDILIVYLSGHGVAAPDGEYWYLTPEAHGTDLSDPAVRTASGISSSELTEWLKAVPALKQVMILDTCAAGAAAAKLTETRALTSDQVRAIERMKDRTGLHVLMGSSANAVSYEASQYGQGLLTYALLEGMRGAALRDEQFVDVQKLFTHAVDQVPRLATSIGGVQRPLVSAPKGSTFDIGQLTADDKAHIPMAMVRPLVLRASFQTEAPPFTDSVELGRRVNKALREASEPGARGGGKLAFVDGEELPGALRLAGRYRETGDRLRVDVYVMDGKKERGHFQVEGAASDLDGLARAVVEKVALTVAGGT